VPQGVSYDAILGAVAMVAAAAIAAGVTADPKYLIGANDNPKYAIQSAYTA